MNKLTIEEDSVLKSLDEQEDRIRKLRFQWAQVRSTFRPVVKGLRALEIDSVFDGDLNVSFSGNKAKLLAVMRLLRRSGFSYRGDPPEANATSWGAYWVNPKLDDPDYVRTTSKLWMYFTSSVCRRVQVGTQMVEEPVYETRCGDDEADDPQASPRATVQPDQPSIEDDIPF